MQLRRGVVLTQKYTIKPQGIIRGGTAESEIDYTEGCLKLSCKAKVGFGFFTITKEFGIEQRVNPLVLSSQFYKQLGTLYSGTGYSVEVTSVNEARLVIEKERVDLMLDLNPIGDLIEIALIYGSVVVMGKKIFLSIQKVPT